MKIFHEIFEWNDPYNLLLQNEVIYIGFIIRWKCIYAVKLLVDLV